MQELLQILSFQLRLYYISYQTYMKVNITQLMGQLVGPFNTDVLQLVNKIGKIPIHNVALILSRKVYDKNIRPQTFSGYQHDL